MKIDIKFSLNEVGLMIEAKKENEWIGIDLIKLKQPCNAYSFCQEWLKNMESYGLGKIYYNNINQ